MYLIDPSTAKDIGGEGKTIMAEFHENGIPVYPAKNQVEAGINKIHEYFNGPSLKIFSNCVRLRSQLQTYKYRDLRPSAKIDQPEKPLKKDDHIGDVS